MTIRSALNSDGVCIGIPGGHFKTFGLEYLTLLDNLVTHFFNWVL